MKSRLLDDNKIKFILDSNQQGMLNQEISSILGISRQYVTKILKQHQRSGAGRRELRCHRIEMINDEEARCSKCQKTKLATEFQWNKRNTPYEHQLSYCNICKTAQAIARLNSDIDKYLCAKWSHLMNKATKLNIPATITREEFCEQFHKQKGLCFYTDKQMLVRRGEGASRESCSADKIIPELGYCKGNVIFCTQLANTVKYNLTLEEIAAWLPSWYDRIQSFINPINLNFVD